MAGLLPGEWDWMRKEPWRRGSGGFEQRRPGLLGNIGRTALGLLSYGPFLPQVNERRRLLAEDRARESEADDLRMNLARMQMEDMTRKQQAASAEQDAIRSAMTQASLRRPGAPTPGLDPVSLPRTPGLPEQYARAAGELAGKGYAGPSMQFAEAAQKMMPESPKPTDEMREYALALQQGYQGTFFDFKRDLKRAGASNVSVNTSDGPFGKPPAGYWRPDPAKPDVAPLPGSKDAVERARQTEADARNAEGRETGDSNVLAAIDKASKLAGFWTVGLVGSQAQKIPGTPARDLAATLDTVKSNIGFDRLQMMRDASATGGALGNVTERELELLQATIAALDQSQSPQQLTENLTRVRTQYEKARQAHARMFSAAQQPYQIHAPAQSPGIMSPADLDARIRSYYVR